MAARTVVECDVCKKEIKPGGRVIEFSAARFDAKTGMPLAKFDRSEFCSDGCVLTAIRGLLNG